MDYRKYIKSYSDFPKKDIMFWDFSYLLKDPIALKSAIEDIKEFTKDKKITKIAAIESKGFTIGSILAYELEKPLILIRKPNLIPGEYLSEEFIKEYGTGSYQIKKDSCDSTDNVLIIYDIMAGSGATIAAINLIKRGGAEVAGLVYITELEYLKGREDLADYEIFSLVGINDKDS
jgi:Adenine/guanine phosphoribosyltransferases and related PRPP-binding proteins